MGGGGKKKKKKKKESNSNCWTLLIPSHLFQIPHCFELKPICPSVIYYQLFWTIFRLPGNSSTIHHSYRGPAVKRKLPFSNAHTNHMSNYVQWGCTVQYWGMTWDHFFHHLALSSQSALAQTTKKISFGLKGSPNWNDKWCVHSLL